MLLKDIKRGFREFQRGKQNVVEEVVFIRGWFLMIYKMPIFLRIYELLCVQ